MLNPKPWNLHFGSARTRNLVNIWISLKNLPIIFRSFHMVRLILTNIGEVKRIQNDCWEVADLTMLLVEIEVSAPIHLPSVLKLYTRDTCHEVEISRFLGDPNVRVYNAEFKNIVFQKGLDGKLKMWKKKEVGLGNEKHDGGNGSVANPILVSSLVGDGDDVVEDVEGEEDSSADIVDVDFDCYRARGRYDEVNQEEEPSKQQMIEHAVQQDTSVEQEVSVGSSQSVIPRGKKAIGSSGITIVRRSARARRDFIEHSIGGRVHRRHGSS